jgi:hypothetical protein
MRANFRAFVDLAIALAASVHKMTGKLSRRSGPL